MNQRINGREINQFYMFNIIKLMNSNKLKNNLKWMKNIINENMSKNENYLFYFFFLPNSRMSIIELINYMKRNQIRNQNEIKMNWISENNNIEQHEILNQHQQQQPQLQIIVIH